MAGSTSVGTTETTAPRWKDRVAAFLVTGFGFGYSPLIPGTVGTIPAVAGFVVIMLAAPRQWHTPLIAAALAVSCILSVALGDWAQRYWKRKDPRTFVLDEIAGFFVTVLLFRADSLLMTCVTAFVATRFFDVVKPPPARQLESLPAGWGILLDDLAASLYAAASLHIVAYFAGPWLGL